jgi:hypothetical protein
VAGDSRRRRGLQIFSRSKPVVGDWQLSRRPALDQPALDALPTFYAAGGSARSIPFCDPDGVDGEGLSLIWLRFGANYPLPRHSHSVDCLYYVVAGEVHLGRRIVRSSEGFFAPADVTYGYTAGPEGVELLEFRAATSFDSQIRESPTGWARILEGVRANRNGWVSEMAPYAENARTANGSVPPGLTSGRLRR